MQAEVPRTVFARGLLQVFTGGFRVYLGPKSKSNDCPKPPKIAKRNTSLHTFGVQVGLKPWPLLWGVTHEGPFVFVLGTQTRIIVSRT